MADNSKCPPNRTTYRDVLTGDLASGDSAIAPFLESNKRWADSFAQSDPDLLARFPTWQAPPILWFGCSDSRQPETTILGAKPGTCFVHRNIANIITATDLSASSVIEYAVNALKVK